MKVDIRVDADFTGDPKTQRLIRELGDKVITSLLALWGYAAKHRTKGVLHGLSPSEIAMVARWEGDAEHFVEVLVRMKWLEKQRKTYVIHEWEIHQPYAFFAEERSQAARNAAETRWNKQRGNDANRMRDVYGQHPPAPDPTPTPIPVPPPRTRDALPLPPPGGGGAAAPQDNNGDNGKGTGNGEIPESKMRLIQKAEPKHHDTLKALYHEVKANSMANQDAVQQAALIGCLPRPELELFYS